jgi:hypothetical protein
MPLKRLSTLIKKSQRATHTPPYIIPTPTFSSNDVVEAGRDARRTAAKRKGYMAAIRAGETNSNQSYQSTVGVRSLMGVQ